MQIFSVNWLTRDEFESFAKQTNTNYDYNHIFKRGLAQILVVQNKYSTCSEILAHAVIHHFHSTFKGAQLIIDKIQIDDENILKSQELSKKCLKKLHDFIINFGSKNGVTQHRIYWENSEVNGFQKCEHFMVNGVNLSENFKHDPTYTVLQMDQSAIEKLAWESIEINDILDIEILRTDDRKISFQWKSRNMYQKIGEKEIPEIIQGIKKLGDYEGHAYEAWSTEKIFKHLSQRDHQLNKSLNSKNKPLLFSWVAIDQTTNSLAGYVTFSLCYKAETNQIYGYCGDAFVEENYRGQKIGRRLFQIMSQFLLEQYRYLHMGEKKIRALYPNLYKNVDTKKVFFRWVCLPSSKNSMAFYRSLGAKDVGNDLSGEKEKMAVFMEDYPILRDMLKISDACSDAEKWEKYALP